MINFHYFCREKAKTTVLDSYLNYYKQTNKSICGKFKSPHAYPIFPCIEKNTFLYGIYHQHDDKNQYILVKYRVND